MQRVRTDGGANSVTIHAAVTVCLVIMPMEAVQVLFWYYVMSVCEREVKCYVMSVYVREDRIK